MNNPEDPELTTLIPDAHKENGAPVFAEPWQAQAFAMTVSLHQAGLFTWPEWAAALSREIKSGGSDDDSGARYYEFWLAALEKLVAEKGAATPAELAATKDAWHDAYLDTPHGQPVELANDAPD